MSEIIKLAKDNFYAGLASKVEEMFGYAMTKKQATEFVRAMESLIGEDLVAAAIKEDKDINVSLCGGTLKIKIIDEHMSRNPRTGEPVKVPKRYAIRLSTSPKDVE